VAALAPHVDPHPPRNLIAKLPMRCCVAPAHDSSPERPRIATDSAGSDVTRPQSILGNDLLGRAQAHRGPLRQERKFMRIAGQAPEGRAA